MAQQDNKFQISRGPNPLGLAWSLLTCYFKYYDQQTCTFRIMFDDRGTSNVQVRICQMGHEDGSGKSWNLEGYITHDLYAYSAGQGFKAYYHSGQRRGSITFESPS